MGSLSINWRFTMRFSSRIFCQLDVTLLCQFTCVLPAPLRQLLLLATMWVMSTVSGPQQPAQLLQMHAWASFVESIHLIFDFPQIVFFMMWPKLGRFQFCHFCFQWCSGLICSMIHLFVFLLAQGIQRALFQHHISNESVPSLFYQPSSLYNFSIHTY